MVTDIQTVLIALVFASQILVLSCLTPRRRNHFYALMFTRYPPQEYPRLYPISPERIQHIQSFFKPLHLIFGIGAAGTLGVGLIRGMPAPELARWMLYCMLVQILPLYLALPWSIKWTKAYRAMPPPRMRSAELRPWRIVDFVSPLRIGLGLFGLGLALVCAVAAHLHRPHLLILSVWCASFSGLLLLRMIYVLVRPIHLGRPDPYMSATDTFRARQHRFRIQFRVGAVFGGFFSLIELYLAQLIRLDGVYLLIAISILFQLIGIGLVLAQGRDLKTRDFSVYRGDGAAQPTP
jgi:hypothetical protein